MVSTVRRQLFMCCGVCFSVVCVLFCCAVLWVVEWRRSVISLLVLSSCLSFFLFLFVLVFGVVRAQPCEHAHYPRTPLCLRLIVSLLFSFLLSHSPPFLLLWNGGV